MKRLEAILFDLEGTLLNPIVDRRQALNLMLQDEGRPPLTTDQVAAFDDGGVMDLCQQALEATGGVKTDDPYPYVQKFIKHYRVVKPDPEQIYPLVRETLENCASKGIKAAICTNKAEKATLSTLKELDLDRYFAFVAGGDTFMVHKPNPGHITGILEALKVSLPNCVFVGDGPNDTAACQKAGMDCIVVTHGLRVADDVKGHATIISGLSELSQAMAKLGFEF